MQKLRVNGQSVPKIETNGQMEAVALPPTLMQSVISNIEKVDVVNLLGTATQSSLLHKSRRVYPSGTGLPRLCWKKG